MKFIILLTIAICISEAISAHVRAKQWKLLALFGYFKDHGRRCTRCSGICNMRTGNLELINSEVFLVCSRPCSPSR